MNREQQAAFLAEMKVFAAEHQPIDWPATMKGTLESQPGYYVVPVVYERPKKKRKRRRK